MRPDNPFNNLNNLPDRTVTAVVSVCAWIGLAVVLLRFAASPVGWIVALVVAIHATRTWLRFRRRAPESN
jgi:hypothetical protein